MQGTVLMLVALSGLGCHNKSADVVFTPPAFGCYGGGSYASIYAAGVAPSCFSSCYTSSYSGCYSSGCYGGGCYGGCYSSCYSGLYDGGHHGCGLFAKLFGGCGWKSHHSSCYSVVLRAATAAASADLVTGPTTAGLTSPRSLAMPCSSITRRSLTRAKSYLGR